MAIFFKDLPASLRVPGTYQEVDASLAGSFSEQKKVLILGQKLAGGKAAEKVVVSVSNPTEVSNLFGAGSQLSSMCKAFLAHNHDLSLYALPFEDATASVAATAKITLSGLPTQKGDVVIYVGDERFAFSVQANDTLDSIARKMVGVLNSKPLPIEVTQDSTNTSVVSLKAAHKGEIGNDLKISVGGIADAVPTGLQVAVTPFSGGSVNPDIKEGLKVLGNTHYHYCIMPFNDANNIKALADELEQRYEPTYQLGCRAFLAFGGTFTETKAFGKSLNSPHLTVLGIKDSPTPSYLAATINGAVASRQLAADPAANLCNTDLKGIMPKTAFSFSERQDLLQSGIATFLISIDSDMVIERQITTYQTDEAGLPSSAYLDIQIPETLDAIRAYTKAEIQHRFAHYKLAKTNEDFAPGLKVMTPDIFRAFLLDLYQRIFLMEKAWVQDYESYKDSLIVERDTQDKTRLLYLDQPTLIGQFYVSTGLIQFK